MMWYIFTKALPPFIMDSLTCVQLLEDNARLPEVPDPGSNPRKANLIDRMYHVTRRCSSLHNTN